MVQVAFYLVAGGFKLMGPQRASKSPRVEHTELQRRVGVREKDAGGGRHCPAGCRGQGLLLLLVGCDLPGTSQGRPEGSTARAGGSAQFCKGAPKARSRRSGPGCRAAERGGTGVGEGEAGSPRARFGRPCALEGARPGGLGRARCAILALAARVRERTAQGAQARREWVRPRTPSRRSPPFERAGQAEAQQGSEGRPIPAAPTAPRFRSWGPAHSPTGGAPISPTKRV
jgi:hypothetical protein